MTAATVETYNLTTYEGRRIRKATRVVWADGAVTEFVERLPKRDAIRQSAAQLGRQS